MKLFKKVSILFLLFVAVDVLVSCCKCPQSDYGVFYLKSMAIEELDNSGQSPVLATTDSLPKNAFGLRLSLTREIFTCITPSFSLLSSSAYAMECDCAGEYVLSAGDTVTAVQVITLFDFDENHAANSDISSYWQVLLTDKLEPLSYFKGALGAYLYSADGLLYKKDILLMQAPTLGSKQQFKIRLVLKNGKVIEQSTKVVYLI